MPPQDGGGLCAEVFDVEPPSTSLSDRTLLSKPSPLQPAAPTSDGHCSAASAVDSGTFSRYLRVLRTNRSYRLYLASHLCQHAGDWFMHVAALLAVDRLAPGSASALSALVLTKTLPLLALSPVGGALADAFDRRRLMAALDVVSAIVVLGNLVALARGSLAILYVASALRSSVLSVYEPVTRSIVPLIVADADDLKRAVTINGIAWSGMIMVGGVVGGFASAYLGVEACFVIDSVTYLMSAFVISLLTGDFCVADRPCGEEEGSSKALHRTAFSAIRSVFRPMVAFVRMMKDLLSYLWICGFGLLALMKSSGSLTWGAADVLNVSFSKVEGDEAATGRRLGTLYSCIGLGCLLGPVVANSFTDTSRPVTLQLACVGALAVMGIGWVGISLAPNFAMVCAFTTIRTIGSSTIWINSTLLLQQLSKKEILGRVLAFEFACAMGFESMAAFLAGCFQDAGYGETLVAQAAAAVGGTLFALWSVHLLFAGGVARKRLYSQANDAGDVTEGEALHESVVI